MKIDPVLMERARLIVRKGADFLNNSKSANKRHRWHENVRIPDLKQSSGFHCLLAHVFGDYWKGLAALRFANEGANSFTQLTDSEIEFIAEYGFALGRKYMTWEALEVAWIEKINLIRNPYHGVL